MRIALLSDCFRPRMNGVTVSVDILALALRANGHEVRLWVPEYPGRTEADPEWVQRFPSWPLLISREDRVLSLTQRARLFRELRTFKPEVVHTHSEFFATALVGSWCRRHQVPLVITCHTYFEQYVRHYLPALLRPLARFLLPHFLGRVFRGADAVIAPSETMRGVLTSYNLPVAVEAIPTGIPDPVPSLRSSSVRVFKREFFNRHPELSFKRLLLTVGRLGREKNPELLLDVLPHVLKQDPSAHLVFVGDGPLRPELERRVAHSGLEAHVTFTGYLERSEVLMLYRLADIFVFASATETQGLVTVEAMLCGVPVVAVGEMGTREFMNGNKGGFMSTPEPETLAGYVNTLLEDDELRWEKGVAAREHALAWTDSVMVDRMLTVYRRVVATYRNDSIGVWQEGFGGEVQRKAAHEPVLQT